MKSVSFLNLDSFLELKKDVSRQCGSVMEQLPRMVKKKEKKRRRRRRKRRRKIAIFENLVIIIEL